MSIPRFLISTIAMTGIALCTGAVSGQSFPSKPIRIVTSAAGGGTDFVARQIAEGISGPLGQPVVIDNRAVGAIVGEVVSKAPPDGYTLMVSGGGLWVAQLFRPVPYDAIKDFAPISLLMREVSILAVHPSLPVRSTKELIALAKARPRDLNYSSGGPGTSSQLSSELFKSLAGVDIVHVPYKGSAAATTAVLSGEVQLTIVDVGVVMPHAKVGKLRALAVTSATPSALAPGLPTVAASGVPGYESTAMTGIFAPAKTPTAIINRLNQETLRVLNREDVKERILNRSGEVIGNSPEQLAADLKSQMATLAKVIREAGIKAD